MAEKPKVAFFDFASCEGDQLQIANLEEDILELLDLVEVVSFREIMKEHSDDYDIAFIEGSIQRPIDEERLKKIRENADFLIAFGNCAVNGNVNKLQKDWSVKEVEDEVYPDGKEHIEGNEFFEAFPTKAVDEVVDVDFYIRGCPVRGDQVLYYVKRLLNTHVDKTKDLDFRTILRNMEMDNRSVVQYNPNKCILCRRCSNICEETLGVDALGVVEKGGLTIISTPQNIGFDNNGCIQCGQCVSSCPVGALYTRSPVELLKEDLGKGGQTIAIDSMALASFVLRNDALSQMDPIKGEKYVLAGLRKLGFNKVILYDYFFSQSQMADTKEKQLILASWCPSSIKYIKERAPDAIDIMEDNAPWNMLLAEESGDITILSSCTAMNNIEGIKHVLTAPDLDELFKQMNVDIKFVDPDEGVYDGKALPKGFVHPGIPRENGDIIISKDIKNKIQGTGQKEGPVNIYPCLKGCVNGGGNYPTIEVEEMEKRIEWLTKLRGVN